MNEILKHATRIRSTQARILETEGSRLLISYSTPVAYIGKDRVIKTSRFHSTTTSRHINEFLEGREAKEVDPSELQEIFVSMKDEILSRNQSEWEATLASFRKWCKENPLVDRSRIVSEKFRREGKIFIEETSIESWRSKRLEHRSRRYVFNDRERNFEPLGRKREREIES